MRTIASWLSDLRGFSPMALKAEAFAKRAAVKAEVAADATASVKKIQLTDIPTLHPVAQFAELYARFSQGALLPDERELMQSEPIMPLLPWLQLIEPIELEGRVDFKVLRQGVKHAERERRTYKDQWISQTVDPEFAEARYNEVIAASILRKPLYSKGQTPTRERSFLYLLRGVFPVFAENRARLRIILIEAEPYSVA